MPHRPLAQGPSSQRLAADPLVAEPVPVAGELETEAFVEQWYDDEEAWDRASATEQAAAAWEDVGRYAKTTGTFWVVKEHVIVPPPDRGPGLASKWEKGS